MKRLVYTQKLQTGISYCTISILIFQYFYVRNIDIRNTQKRNIRTTRNLIRIIEGINVGRYKWVDIGKKFFLENSFIIYLGTHAQIKTY